MKYRINKDNKSEERSGTRRSKWRVLAAVLALLVLAQPLLTQNMAAYAEETPTERTDSVEPAVTVSSDDA